jgi:membrane protein DedA with SNARE-associated domain
MTISSILLSGFFQLITDPAHLIQYGGIILLLVIIYLETGFFLGLVLPGGDYLMFTAGLLCGTHYLDVPLFLLVSSMIAAAVLGDFTGYAKGKCRNFTDQIQLPECSRGGNLDRFSDSAWILPRQSLSPTDQL